MTRLPEAKAISSCAERLRGSISARSSRLPSTRKGTARQRRASLSGISPSTSSGIPRRSSSAAERDAELLGEPLEQQLLGEGVHLQQAGAEPAAGHVLVFQGAGELLDRDPAARHQKLSELGHVLETAFEPAWVPLLASSL